MRVSRSEPGVVISSAAHAGLLVAALVLFSDAPKFDDVEEPIPVEVVTEDAPTQVTKGEKTAPHAKPAHRADKVAKEAEAKPHPPLAEARKDVPVPPPPLKRLPDPGADDKPEPLPPKRVAALPPAPEPPTRPVEKKPEPQKPVERPAEAKPAPAPPAKPKAAAPEKEPDEPKDAEIVKPKPPQRPKPEKEAKETPKPEKKPEPEKADVKVEVKPAPEKPRLKADDVARLLESKKAEEKPAKTQNGAEGEAAERNMRGAKPKSGDENAPKSKFDAASIANMLSKEAPQRRAATDKEIRTASIGTPAGAAPKLSASMEARIASYIHDHYHPCWASALSLGGATFAPVVEFHLSRDGALEGRPRLVNPSANPVEQARGEQAVQAVRRCSPMKIPSEFMPFYEEALHEVTIRFQDAN
ncbi:hypothetical protein [Methylocystis parvus]|uniref:Cell envelope biogenesis protein TolA n=1 Tax=Methylocystis parvus TaxID=134 RepID=A0A6B8M6W7_9HYPH|nr:hypothetical protein [Methylocystis parvus]QGM98591.1 cell envelope biogenesis protein TolA [Methylocystis parvus]WBK01066.1 cell envelope biogenesis protein TolA [Methylocystis parvus OBBP]